MIIDKLRLLVTTSKSCVEIKMGELLTIKVPKEWQKPDADIKSQALWVANLSDNVLGIKLVKFYPSVLVMESKGRVYEGRLFLIREEEEKKIYDCEMKEVKKTNWFKFIVIFIIIFLILKMISTSNRI